MPQSTTPIYLTIMLSVATFIIGGGMVPKMDFIPNVVRIWFLALGFGLLAASLWFMFGQSWLLTWIPRHSHTVMVIGVWGFSLLVVVIVGTSWTVATSRFEGRQQLKVDTDKLIADISLFLADRSLSQPMVPSGGDMTVIEAWMQRNREFSGITNTTFVGRFQSDVERIGDRYLNMGLIDKNKWHHYMFVVDPQSPSITNVLWMLKEFRASIR